MSMRIPCGPDSVPVQIAEIISKSVEMLPSKEPST